MARMRFPGRPAVRPDRNLVHGRVPEPPDDASLLKSVVHSFGLGFELFESVQSAFDENALRVAFTKLDVLSLQRRLLKMDRQRRAGSSAFGGGSRRGRGRSSSTDSDGGRHGRRTDGAAAVEKPAGAARASAATVRGRRGRLLAGRRSGRPAAAAAAVAGGRRSRFAAGLPKTSSSRRCRPRRAPAWLDDGGEAERRASSDERAAPRHGRVAAAATRKSKSLLNKARARVMLTGSRAAQGRRPVVPVAAASAVLRKAERQQVPVPGRKQLKGLKQQQQKQLLRRQQRSESSANRRRSSTGVDVKVEECGRAPAAVAPAKRSKAPVAVESSLSSEPDEVAALSRRRKSRVESSEDQEEKIEAIKEGQDSSAKGDEEMAKSRMSTDDGDAATANRAATSKARTAGAGRRPSLLKGTGKKRQQSRLATRRRPRLKCKLLKVKLKMKVKKAEPLMAAPAAVKGRAKSLVLFGRKALSRLARKSGRGLVSRPVRARGRPPATLATDGSPDAVAAPDAAASGDQAVPLGATPKPRPHLKQFVLPHVSARSSRKIVPTRRFIEEYEVDAAAGPRVPTAPKRFKLELDEGVDAEASSAEGTAPAQSTHDSSQRTTRARSCSSDAAGETGDAADDCTALQGRQVHRSRARRDRCSADSTTPADAETAVGDLTDRDKCIAAADGSSSSMPSGDGSGSRERPRRVRRPAKKNGFAAAGESVAPSATTAAATAILVKARKQLTLAQSKKARSHRHNAISETIGQCVVCERNTRDTYFSMTACSSCKRFYQRYVVMPVLPQRIQECIRGVDVEPGQCTCVLLLNEDYCAACHFAKCVVTFPFSERLKIAKLASEAMAGESSQAVPISTQGTDGECVKGEASSTDVEGATDGINVEQTRPDGTATASVSEGTRNLRRRVTSIIEDPQPAAPISSPVVAEATTTPEGAGAGGGGGGPRIKHVCRSASVAQGTPARYPPSSLGDIRLSALPPDEKSAILRQEEQTDDDDDDEESDRRRSGIRAGGAAGCTEKIDCRAGLTADGGMSLGNSSPAVDTKPVTVGRASKPPRRMRRCEKCENCLRPCCGKCMPCRNMIKFGGPGTLKKSCVERNCLAPLIQPTTSLSGGRRHGHKKKPANLQTPGNDGSATQAAAAAPVTAGAGAAVVVDEARSQSGRDAASIDGSVAGGRGREGDRSRLVAPLSLMTAAASAVQRVTAQQALRDEAVHRILVDFKTSNFDVNVVWQAGMPLIYSRTSCTRTVCYLCGSSGNYEFLYCAVCCEPFHDFCLYENERPKSGELDWVCRKCQFCATCGQLGNLLKCARCSDSYHGSCLSVGHPSKPSRSKTWVCSRCVRCKSCGATSPGTAPGARWTDDFTLCYGCSRLKAKGNVCPICECCYADDDWDSDMVECSGCKSWVHTKCEHISYEMYEIMSNLPDHESPYQCRSCCAPATMDVACETNGADGGVRARSVAAAGEASSVQTPDPGLPWVKEMSVILQQLLRRVVGALLSQKCAQHLVRVSPSGVVRHAAGQHGAVQQQSAADQLSSSAAEADRSGQFSVPPPAVVAVVELLATGAGSIADRAVDGIDGHSARDSSELPSASTAVAGELFNGSSSSRCGATSGTPPPPPPEGDSCGGADRLSCSSVDVPATMPLADATTSAAVVAAARATAATADHHPAHVVDVATLTNFGHVVASPAVANATVVTGPAAVSPESVVVTSDSAAVVINPSVAIGGLASAIGGTTHCSLSDDSVAVSCQPVVRSDAVVHASASVHAAESESRISSFVEPESAGLPASHVSAAVPLSDPGRRQPALHPSRPVDFSAISRLVEEGKYDRVWTFAEDVVRIIVSAFEREKFEDKENTVLHKFNNIVHYTFVKEMQQAFPWFDVKSEELWSSTSKSHDSPSKGAPPVSEHAAKCNDVGRNCVAPDDEDGVAVGDDDAGGVAGTVDDNIASDAAADIAAIEASSEAAAGCDPTADRRRCILCSHYGDGPPDEVGRLLYAGQDEWVHVNCAIWSAEVFEEVDGTLQNVQAAFTRGRQLECEHCHTRGATVGCCLRGCSANFHFMCARSRGCAFQDDKKMFCYRHVRHVDGPVIDGSKFCVERMVTIDFQEAKISRKAWQLGLLPQDIRISIGSLCIDNLGRLSAVSDAHALLLPAGYSVRRVFWSTVNPFKKCVYTCRIVEVKPPSEEKPAEVVIPEMTFCHDESQPNYVSPADLHRLLPAICRPRPQPPQARCSAAATAKRRTATAVSNGQQSDCGDAAVVRNKKRKIAAPSGSAFASVDSSCSAQTTVSLLPPTDGGGRQTPTVCSPPPAPAAAAASASIVASASFSSSSSAVARHGASAATVAMLSAVSAAKSSGGNAFASSWPGASGATARVVAVSRPAGLQMAAAKLPTAEVPAAADSALSQSWPLRQNPTSVTVSASSRVDLNCLSEKTRRQLGTLSVISAMPVTVDDQLENVSLLTQFTRTLNKAASKNAKGSTGTITAEPAPGDESNASPSQQQLLPPPEQQQEPPQRRASSSSCTDTASDSELPFADNSDDDDDKLDGKFSRATAATSGSSAAAAADRCSSIPLANVDGPVASVAPDNSTACGVGSRSGSIGWPAQQHQAGSVDLLTKLAFHPANVLVAGPCSSVGAAVEPAGGAAPAAAAADDCAPSGAVDSTSPVQLGGSGGTAPEPVAGAVVEATRGIAALHSAVIGSGTSASEANINMVSEIGALETVTLFSDLSDAHLAVSGTPHTHAGEPLAERNVPVPGSSIGSVDVFAASDSASRDVNLDGAGPCAAGVRVSTTEACRVADLATSSPLEADVRPGAASSLPPVSESLAERAGRPACSDESRVVSPVTAALPIDALEEVLLAGDEPSTAAIVEVGLEDDYLASSSSTSSSSSETSGEGGVGGLPVVCCVDECPVVPSRQAPLLMISTAPSSAYDLLQHDRRALAVVASEEPSLDIGAASGAVVLPHSADSGSTVVGSSPSALMSPPMIVITDFSSRTADSSSGGGSSSSAATAAADALSPPAEHLSQALLPCAPCSGGGGGAGSPILDSTRDKLLRTLVKRNSDPAMMAAAAAAAAAATTTSNRPAGCSSRVALELPVVSPACTASATAATGVAASPTGGEAVASYGSTVPTSSASSSAPDVNLSSSAVSSTGSAAVCAAAATSDVAVSAALLLHAPTPLTSRLELSTEAVSRVNRPPVVHEICPPAEASAGCAIRELQTPAAAPPFDGDSTPTTVLRSDLPRLHSLLSSDCGNMSSLPSIVADHATAASHVVGGAPVHSAAVSSVSQVPSSSSSSFVTASPLPTVTVLASASSSLATAAASVARLNGGAAVSFGRTVSLLADRQQVVCSSGTLGTDTAPLASRIAQPGAAAVASGTLVATAAAGSEDGGSSAGRPAASGACFVTLGSDRQQHVLLLRAACPTTAVQSYLSNMSSPSVLAATPAGLTIVRPQQQSSASSTPVMRIVLASGGAAAVSAATPIGTKQTYVGSVRVTPNGHVTGLERLKEVPSIKGGSAYRLVTPQLVQDINTAARSLSLPSGCSVVVPGPSVAASAAQQQQQQTIVVTQQPSSVMAPQATQVSQAVHIVRCADANASAIQNVVTSASTTIRVDARGNNGVPQRTSSSSSPSSLSLASGAKRPIVTVTASSVSQVKRLKADNVSGGSGSSSSVSGRTTSSGSSMLPKPMDVISNVGQSRFRTITFPRGVSPSSLASGLCNGSSIVATTGNTTGVVSVASTATAPSVVRVSVPRVGGGGGGGSGGLMVVGSGGSSTSRGRGSVSSVRRPSAGAAAAGVRSLSTHAAVGRAVALTGLGNTTTIPVNIDKWIRETDAARGVDRSTSQLTAPSAAGNCGSSEQQQQQGQERSDSVGAGSSGSGSLGGRGADASSLPRGPTVGGPYRKAKVIAGTPKRGQQQRQQPKSVGRKMSRLVFEITSDDGFSTQADSYADAWQTVVYRVQEARQQWAANNPGSAGRRPLSFAAIKGAAMYGLDNCAVVRLVEQLYGARLCRKYQFKYCRPPKVEIEEEPPENATGSARSEVMNRPRPPFEMFAFLHSQYRTMRTDISKQSSDVELAQKSSRRATSMELPVAMRYRALQQKNHAKEAVGVYRSSIHGRGLFCMRPIDAGEMIIEYAGEVIRSSLTDVREKYYESKGIGCYMFRIDEFEVVDATLRGNASRFINHCCEPNCYSRIITVENKKHIVIYASRAIQPGEELTYDYKFPFEEVKIPCNCGVRKCRKYLN